MYICIYKHSRHAPFALQTVLVKLKEFGRNMREWVSE